MNRPLPQWVVNFFICLALLTVISVPWNWRHIGAYAEFRQGMSALSGGDLDGGARLLSAAAARVPESSELAGVADYFGGLSLLIAGKNQEALERFKASRVNPPGGSDPETMIARAEIGIAFDRKDYRAFLVLAQKLLAIAPESPEFAAQVASAYACLYAEKGRPADKAKALEQLAFSLTLAGEKDPEYEQRIRHRLAKRVIIDRAEYARRFPNGWKEGRKLMPFIPGVFIAILTFPGVIVHEAAHFLFCRLRGVPIFDAKFFQVVGLDQPVGFVVHGPTKDFTTSFLVSVGPFFLNSILCVAICFPLWIPMQFFDAGDPFCYFVMWLGVSIGMHAFPSNQDVNDLWSEAKEEAAGGNWLARVTMPLVVAIWAANLLRFFWIDYAYGLALAIWLPSIVLG